MARRWAGSAPAHLTGPIPLDLHRAGIRAVDGLRIQVSPLEALDRTPVLDIKPVLDPAAER